MFVLILFVALLLPTAGHIHACVRMQSLKRLPYLPCHEASHAMRFSPFSAYLFSPRVTSLQDACALGAAGLSAA